MKVSNNQNPMDVLAATAQAGTGGKAKGGFKNLLSAMLQKLEGASSQSGLPQGAEAPANPPAEKPKTQADDATASAAVASAATPNPQEPQATQDSEPQATGDPGSPAPQGVAAATAATTGQQGASPTATAQAAALPTAAPAQTQEAQGGDILSVETVILPSAEGEQAPLPAQAQAQAAPSTQEGDRLGTMLGQKQQELASITGQNGQAGQAQPQAPQAQSPAPAAPPPESQQPQQPAPPLTAAETPKPEVPVQPAPESPDLPTAQPDEAPQTRVLAEPDHKTVEQLPISELPESDRAVLEMKEARPEPIRKEEPKPELEQAAAPEPKPQPAPTQEAQRSEPARPEQPAPRSDQMEQVRLEVTRNLEQNKMEFRMQLQPEELGKVSVKLVLESGRLAVEIMAATPKAAELLAKQAEGLIQSLRAQQFDVQSVNIVTQTQEAGSHMNGAFSMLGGQGQAQDGGKQAGRLSPGHQAQAEGDPADEGEDQSRSPESLLDRAI